MGGGYFTTLHGEQIELALGPKDEPNGPTYLRALDEFTKRMRLETNRGTPDYLVSALFNQYRLHLEYHGNGRREHFDTLATSFANLYGQEKVADIRAYHFDDWLRAQTEWNDSSKNRAGKLVMMAFNWGVKKGLIPANPVRGKIELPEPHTRGREARMSPELCQLLIAGSYTEEFRIFQRMLWLTGCRPVEVRMATAGHCKAGKIVYPWNARKGEYRHKTAKTKRDRVIHLPPELLGEVEALIAKYPTGPLFRTPRGLPWKGGNLSATWEHVLNRKEVKAYLAEHNIDRATIIPYNYRHTFISDWIDQGRSIHVCARLTGTSVAMIEKVYGHPDDERMRDAYLTFLAAR
jgi:integrase